MDTKKLFIGFQLNDDWKHAISEFIQGQNSLNVRWVPEDNWHFTLLFLGDYPTQKIKELGKALASHFRKQKAFAIPFDTFTYAPHPRRPRMIWCKGAANNNFKNIVNNTFEALETYNRVEGIEIQVDKFEEPIPHITLSKFQKMYVPPLRILNANDYPLPLLCDKAILFEANEVDGNHEYDILESFPLSTKN